MGSGAGVFRPRSLWRPRGRGRRQAAPRLSGCPGSAPRPLGFAGELAGRRGNARLPVGPPRPASRPFPLLVPRTGPRLPFPGGPRAWRRPAGKLTRDSRSLPPAAPRLRASGAVASATASRAAGCVPRPEARAGGPGFSAAASADSSTIWSSVTVACAAPSKMGRGLLFQVPFTLGFPKIYYALHGKWNPVFRMLVCFAPHLLA